MNVKKNATTTNYNCYHFSGKTGKIAKQRLSAMQQNDKKEHGTTYTNKSDSK